MFQISIVGMIEHILHTQPVQRDGSLSIKSMVSTRRIPGGEGGKSRIKSKVFKFPIRSFNYFGVCVGGGIGLN